MTDDPIILEGDFVLRSGEHGNEYVLDPEFWVVCPSCDEIVPRNEMNEHVCPIEGLEDD